ncbi:ATP-dependent nuclease [Pinibacter soli]|uniref:ATP-dependent endonuclease n=1 Tax=Pinibacter soli TaxID=3044211 RepID=A0ABT6RFT9_9BACT|nr:ATP-dependent endonuclease [Pinibacter soli]MDI3321415.1 ATP-dependent endonuclease [Pinibacter soli]
MKIIKLEVENFRLLKKFSIDLEGDLSLIIGKNNTGKTSILSVLDKFLNEKYKFSYDDLNIDFKNDLEALIKAAGTPEEFAPKGIKLKVFIEYDEKDDLSNVSRVLMDLDPDNNKIVLGFEYTLSYTDFLRVRAEYSDFSRTENEKAEKNEKYKPRDLKDFLKRGIDDYFDTHKKSFEYDIVNNIVNEGNSINLESEGISIKDILSFKYISAKRDVTNKEKENTLSKQTSALYKKKEDTSDKTQATENFKDQLSETDNTLSDIYKDLFKDVIEKVQNFGGIRLNDTDIAIISTLQHRELLEGNTTVVYTHDEHKLPEHYNGLGYMNLISIIFEIEILVQDFKRDKDKKPADINLLIIEEPEAHTHPQMQYVFIKNIKKLLAQGVKREDGITRPLQYIITTHSAHIVADSDFDDIKYLKAESKNNVVARNLKDLKQEYEVNTDQYQFLKQYLTISRAEIFFADKAILIEGDTERILIPTFMRKVDLEEAARLKAEHKEDNFLPLLSQNISIIEVGAYSQIFGKFIEFLGIKALIVTDIDSKGDIGNKDKKGNIVLEACPVHLGIETSNTALLHFLDSTSWQDLKILTIEQRTLTRGSAFICVCYQQEEENTGKKKYHARSFEDAFIHLNRDFVKKNKTTFRGLKNADDFNNDGICAYNLAESCIKKKTHFALDILYHSDENFSNWNIPAYIKNGLLWLKKD